MASDFINRLIDLIISPYGFVGIVIGLILLNQARQSRRLAWLLFSLCCYAASLGKFQDQWVKEPPALVFPLQQVRDMGRPLTIVLLGLLLILGMQAVNGWRRMLMPQPVKYLMMLQAAIFFKTLFYGDIAFALLAALTFAAMVLMIRLGPCRWLQNEYNFNLGIWSLAMVGVIFAIACIYQGIFDMYPMTFSHGRFLGTTGNSQHAAALLAGTTPCLMFLIESRKKWDWLKVFWIISLLVIAYFLFLTGSRTGAIMGITSVLLFYRNRGGALLRLSLFAGVLLVVIFSVTSPDVISSNAADTNRYTSGDNTRAAAWSGMWHGFINYPIFGAPLEGGRLGFGESAWLAAGDTTGLIGFIPLVMMGLGCLKMMLKLHILSTKKPIYFLHTSPVIAGLAGLLAGSFTEALFMGNLSFPVMALIMYLSLGKYLLDVDTVQDKYFIVAENANPNFYKNG